MSKRRSPYVVLLLCVVAFAMQAAAPEPAAAPAKVPAPAKVMLLGVFHFANPGMDMVKSEVIDVTTPANQAYLAGLAQRLAAFGPTDVLVECDPAAQARQDAQFAAWRDGDAALTVNEVQQIGFRVAGEAGLSTVTCFDEGGVQWKAGPMFEYMAAHASNVQQAAARGRRVLVVAGQGHTAILRDLLALDGERQAEDVMPYLVP